MSRSQTKQKKSSAAKNVAIFFIVFIILEGLIVFGLSKLFKNEDSVVTIGGYSFYLMDSDNMAPDSPKNSLVIAAEGVPSPDKTGYAVLCKNVGSEGTTVGWLLDVSSKGDTVDGVVYTVYQNSAPDKHYDLKSDDIIGIATSYYMTAGKIISFVATPFGMAICIAAPLVLLVVIELIMAIARRSNDDDYDDDDEDYDDEGDENVTLDDFLYGGENDEVYTSEKPKDTYQEEFEDKYASMMRKTERPAPVYEEPEQPVEEPVYEEPAQPVQPVQTEEPAPAPVQQEAPAEEPAVEAKPEIDPTYYERASKMIDEAVTTKEEPQEAPAEEPAPAPAPEKKPEPARRPRPANGQPPRKRPPQHGARPAGARRPAQHRPANRPAAPRQDANAALAQLMKMMEEEQNKLKDQNKDK